jgi:DNA-binding Lrp family transcriptional regulator
VQIAFVFVLADVDEIETVILKIKRVEKVEKVYEVFDYNYNLIVLTQGQNKEELSKCSMRIMYLPGVTRTTTKWAEAK